MMTSPRINPTIREQSSGRRTPPRHDILHTTIEGGGRIRTVTEQEIDQAVAMLVADPGDSDQQIAQKKDHFLNVAVENHYDLTAINIALHQGRLTHAAFASQYTAAAGFVFTSAPPTSSQDAVAFELAVASLEHTCRQIENRGAHVLQMLLEPQDQSRSRLAAQSGFREVTQIVYMVRPVDAAHVPASLPADFSWTIYSPQAHEQFRDAIQKTYVDSMDCPELSRLRSADEALTGHKGGSDFDSSLWQLLTYRDKPAGVVLVAPVAGVPMMELVYMGVVAQHRGTGLGRLLVEQALHLSAQRNCKSLTFAVDKRNTPALHLYHHMSFFDVQERTVLIRSHRW